MLIQVLRDKGLLAMEVSPADLLKDIRSSTTKIPKKVNEMPAADQAAAPKLVVTEDRFC